MPLNHAEQCVLPSRLGAPYGKTVGLAILAYKAPRTTQASIENHQAHGLYALFDQVVVCFQACSDEDLAMANRCGVRAVGRPDNVGIQGGFRWAWETLKTDYVLILENDIPVCVSPERMREQLCEAIERLEAREVDLVRLRHRFNPGEQNRFAAPYAWYWSIYETDVRWNDTEPICRVSKGRKWLRRVVHPFKAQKWCGRSPYIEARPEKLFPRWIKRIGPDFLCVDSWVLPWTNQCTLISHDLMGELLDYADRHPAQRIHNSEGNKLQTLETPLNCLWWKRRHFRIGLPEGVFTHCRLDRGRAPRDVHAVPLRVKGVNYECRVYAGIAVVGLLLGSGFALSSISWLPWVLLALLGGGGIYLSGKVAWWYPRIKSAQPSVLMLHSVSDSVVDSACANNSLRPRELEHLIADLQKAGYTFQTLTAAIQAPVKRSVVLTFDDGYVDNYKVLFPILKAYGVPATCFVTNRGKTNQDFLSVEQIREMHASGLVEFGGHTANHTVLDTVALETARGEVVDNRVWLTEVLGEAPTTFAYPCGGYNAEVIELVKGAGYSFAVTMKKKMQPLLKDPFQIHRQIIPRGKAPWQAYFLATRGKYKL